MSEQPDRLVVLTDAPLVPKRDARCPRCQAGPDRRRASAGFGVPHPVCGRCGYEFLDEEWT